jgi:peptidoglycan/LPS O-acetylase OafA/YrhL
MARDCGNDALRGVAILTVVLTHTTAEWAAFAAGHPLAAAYRALRPALDVWVPLFLVVSGYYCGREEVGSWRAYGAYLVRRGGRILPPYLLWATLLFALGVAGGTWRASDYVVGVVNGRFAYPYYFVSVLVKLVVAYPLLRWALGAPARAALTLAAAGGLWFYACLPDDPLALRTNGLTEVLFRRTVHAEWAVFFLLGVFFRLRTGGGRRAASRPAWEPVALVALAALGTLGAGIAACGRFVPGHAAGIAGVVAFLGVNTAAGERIAAHGPRLARLGAHSYAIYLLHEPWLQWTKNALGAAVQERPLQVQLPLLLVAIGVPLALCRGARVLFGPRAAWVTG